MTKQLQEENFCAAWSSSAHRNNIFTLVVTLTVKSNVQICPMACFYQMMYSMTIWQS